ncbi:protease modulator HflC [Vannielia litorea]|uniref:protease modulator HflC n=1 Tax=Vannielia litorea TaxID=1217970 RepID=UPI001C97E48C|nr:protease modulator HflC [Vannielia litorea]MBY6046446.1 protease modulator HflC [Vannielia litorea]MBY6073859.1 protease modulator HflC [Vannielia litorea]
MNRLSYLLPIVAIALAALLSSIFIVDEREQVLVLRFGQIKQERTEPGLYFKVPLFDEVVDYEDRILSIETPLIEVTPADDRRLVVDAFVLWRITDMVQFRQAIGIGDERAAQIQLNDILDGQIRAVLGSEGVTSNTILSPERTALMDQIEVRVNDRAGELGIEVVDVRLRQTNLPEQNFDATLKRMIAEREREAIDERARGQEAGQRVRAAADRTYAEIIAEANRDARIIQGQADAERNRIFAEAYGQDQEFFEFYRSLSAYENSLKGNNSSMVMSPDSEFFNYLRTDGSGSGVAPAPVDEAAAAAARAANEAAIRAAEESAAETASEAEAVIEELPDTSVAGEAAEGATGETAPAEAAPAEEAPVEEAPVEEAPAEEAPAEETPADDTTGN